MARSEPDYKVHGSKVAVQLIVIIIYVSHSRAAGKEEKRAIEKVALLRKFIDTR
jgi:hypothetical protein